MYGFIGPGVSCYTIYWFASCRYSVSGQPKPKSVEQALLVSEVSTFVSQFVQDFTTHDIVYVRSMRSPRMGIYNVQCRTVTKANQVKSTFASLIKSDDPPDYLGKISISYSHSLGTRIRLSIMRAISKRQHDHDPKSICTVMSFTARPMMR